MEQLHKRFTDGQVKLLLEKYCEGVLDRNTVEGVLGMGKTRFFALLKQYRLNPKGFPQAKGKMERPYRWLQDRIVRTCAIEKLTTTDEVRGVLKEEVDRYNNHQVHSTTGEIPSIHFEKARKAGNSLFRPFALPKPYTLARDVFCLREKHMVNGYRRISLFNHEIEVPGVPLREEVEVHLVPDPGKGALANLKKRDSIGIIRLKLYLECLQFLGLSR